MHKWFVLLIFFTLNSFAQELPEHLQEVLGNSHAYFEIYNAKSPQEIDDGKFDESEVSLFAQIDQINGLDIIFCKDEIKTLKLKMIELIAQSFDEEQLAAIARIGRSNQLNKKQAAGFFEVALEYKSGKLKHLKLPLRR